MPQYPEPFQKTILFSSYLCNPFSVSEANTAFEWLKILLTRFNIVLFTTDEEERSIKQYYNNSLPANLTIISFTDRYPFKSKSIIKNTVRLGYFYFNYKIKGYLRKHPEVIAQCDILFQKSPESFRYYTSLTAFGKPVYIGPLSGGLKPPGQLKGYFRREHSLYKLRNLDPLIMKLPVYKRQFSKIKKVLISFDYVEELLPPQFLTRKKVLINAGIDCAPYQQARNDTAIINILHIARLTRYKATELLIRALNNIKETNFVLNIVGRGEEQEHLEALVKEYGLSDKIIFHGYKPVDEVKQFYQSASLFCLPTLTESAGNVFFEAMASGLPVITMDNGGPKYICPDQGAIKIPVTSEEGIISDLQQSITLLMNDPKKREEMGKFNRAYCRENYDWSVLKKKILDFFDEEMSNLS